MKIAIQGHLDRGKEVIQILESLGGKNIDKLEGTYETFYYINDKSEICDDHKKNFPLTYKLYTLKEFEKEFPFKIGDPVIDSEGNEGVIIDLVIVNDKFVYSIKYNYNQFDIASPNLLKLKKKEMKEERNITLTLDKAREWYKKGAELKEIALQAYSEEELTKVDLPKTWEEFYKQYEFKPVLDLCLSAVSNNFSMKYVNKFKAFVKLQYLRDCWRQGWIPDYTKTYKKFRIKKLGTEYIVDWSTGLSDFLVFQTEELAKEFLKCFRDLIEKAGDLI